MTDLDELDETDDFVKLMTFHSAKGLEFPVVYMVGCEEGLFPHSQSDWDPSELEEERRLCYVGMTRAKKLLCLTHANARRVRGIPQLNIHSRFLDELPREYVTEIDLRRRVKRPITRPMHENELFGQDDSSDDFNQESDGPSFRTGTRVQPPTFGRGIICRVEGEEEATKLTIKFDNGHIKKFMATQTPLQVL